MSNGEVCAIRSVAKQADVPRRTVHLLRLAFADHLLPELRAKFERTCCGFFQRNVAKRTDFYSTPMIALSVLNSAASPEERAMSEMP